MKLIDSVKELLTILENEKLKGRTIGFVPTMGALHKGHISLIKQAASKNQIVVCSIFVNPTQFNNKSDLKKYPRTLDTDLQLLQEVKCDYIFAPSTKEIYPKNLDTKLNINFNGLDKVMEGKFRPGHFEGMAQVVKRLLDIVQPDHLYMGQKDFQQFTIVAHMIKKLKIPTQLVVCKIIREKSGLAMSSRNARLSPALREAAAMINKTLLWAYRNRSKWAVKELEAKAMEKLKIEHFEPEYFNLVDGLTLKAVKDTSNHTYIVACVACWVGGVRLIDNKIFVGP